MSESDKKTRHLGSTITANFNVSVSYQLKPGLTAEQASNFIEGKLDEAIASIQETLIHLRYEEPRSERRLCSAPDWSSDEYGGSGGLDA